MKPKIGKKYSRMIQNKDNFHEDPVYVSPFKGDNIFPLIIQICFTEIRSKTKILSNFNRKKNHIASSFSNELFKNSQVL